MPQLAGLLLPGDSERPILSCEANRADIIVVARSYQSAAAMSPKDDPRVDVVLNKPAKAKEGTTTATQSQKHRGLHVKDAVKMLVLVDMFSVALVVSLLPSYFKDLTDRYAAGASTRRVCSCAGR